MKTREIILAGILGALFLGGIGYFFSSIVLEPISIARRQSEDIRKENKALAASNQENQARLKRMAALNQRSLPADIDVARREYETALSRLLTASRIGVYSISIAKDQPNEAPQIEQERQAYRKITLSISMNKVDVAAMTSFLEGYYRLNLLHHITSITIKRDTGLPAKKDTPESRRDLEVKFTTEAIIVNGTEKKTLLAVSDAHGAAIGSLGLVTLRQSPTVARSLKPMQIERVLAIPDRDYSLLAYRDPFHGPYPIPEPPPKKKEEPPPPPKPGVEAFLIYTMLIRKSDGTALAVIYDKANGQFYEVVISKNATISIDVTKQEYYSSGDLRDATRSRNGLLAISDKTSSTRRNFRVYGLDGTNLILGERSEEPVKDAKSTARPGGGGRLSGSGTRTTTTTALANPFMAIGGGTAALAARPEKYYLWENGQLLSKLRELKPDAAREAITRANSW